MKLFLLVAFVASVTAYARHRDVIPKGVMNLKGDALRDYINSLGTTWKAGDAHLSHRKTLMDIKYTKHPEGVEYAAEINFDKDIPDSFDARTQWPACKTIGAIRDQSQCGGCWAFGAAEALSDRACIASNGKVNVELSPEDPISCCGSYCGYGCGGGQPISAWQWAITKGFSTGSGYYENAGCKPYSVEPCGTHIVNGVTHYHNCTDDGPATPICSSTCTNPNYNISYSDDKHFAKSAYAIKNSVAAIQKEIMTYGPVEATFEVFEDFDHYQSGVYEYSYGWPVGGHAVKILGWGTDNGTPYWLVANSWNTNWGENGFFRFVRGKNDCGFEDGVTAGFAKV